MAEAHPLHAGTKRIARVVLLSVNAGLALAEGDTAAAIEIGTLADAERTELGVDREMLLITGRGRHPAPGTGRRPSRSHSR